MEQAVVGGQGVHQGAGAAQFGAFAHPAQVGGALGVQVLLGVAAQRQGQHHLGEQHAP
ncbi:hypothetical protein [Kitasatospora sp. NPDC091276]|uniref:hypothetical protein n=1 Tax=Kitasatospora sp. NPDC091276 TaxID=3155300 RepID=UPI0034266E41